MDQLLVGGIIFVFVLAILLWWRISEDNESKKMRKEVSNRHAWEMRVRAMQQAERDGKNYFDLLLDDICPLCGEKVETKTYGSADQYSDHKCAKCGFSTVGEVLV